MRCYDERPDPMGIMTPWALIFRTGDGFVVAGAWSRGNYASLTGLLENASTVKGGVLDAFIHTHPQNVSFSYPDQVIYANGAEQPYITHEGDIRTAFDRGIDAFVTLPDGTIDEFSSSRLQSIFDDPVRRFELHRASVQSTEAIRRVRTARGGG